MSGEGGAAGGGAAHSALLVDFGGVLTSNVFDSFREFCEREGLEPGAVKRLFREDPDALALWKAAVFMEGNYKRSLAGTTDDPWLRMFDEGVPQLAEAAREITRMPAPSA